MLRAALAALLLAAAPGALDDGFGDHGRVAFPVGDESWAYTLRLDSAGRTLLGGFADVAGGNALAVARLTARGRLDPASASTASPRRPSRA